MKKAEEEEEFGRMRIRLHHTKQSSLTHEMFDRAKIYSRQGETQLTSAKSIVQEEEFRLIVLNCHWDSISRESLLRDLLILSEDTGQL